MKTYETKLFTEMCKNLKKVVRPDEKLVWNELSNLFQVDKKMSPTKLPANHRNTT